jgi:hypothetical protein
MTAREMYADLLIKIVANTIYGDPPVAPQNTLFEESARAEGKDWPSMAHTMVGLRRLENLRDLTQRVLDENIPGHFIDTGVCEEDVAS